MPKSVVVLTGGLASESPAIRRALEVAGKDAEVELFDVVYEPLLEGYMGNREIYEPLRRRVVAERQETVEQLAKALAAKGVRATAKAVWDHPLHEAVAKEVRARNADLLVTAPKLEGGPGLSHSDWQLALTSPVPTLIVKSNATEPYRRIVAAVDPLHTHAKPAALDEVILRHAKTLAATVGATLTVLHCYTPLDYFGADLGALPAGPDERRKAVAELSAAAGIGADAARVVAGVPDEVLRDMGSKGEADLIVMGVLARNRIREILVGHTAERVLHHTGIDVLVVKPGP